MTSRSMLTVLTVAGFDPSGGAGILADIKTVGFFGCFGVAAMTSLTVQNTTGVFAAYKLPRDLVSQQMDRLFEDFDISAVKTGMLPNHEVIEAVAETISQRKPQFLVVDPVLRSTSGFALTENKTIGAFVSTLLPLSSLITPSKEEAERFSGVPVTDVEGMKRAAQLIFDLGAKAVLVKGGDIESDGDMVTDVLFDEAGPFTISTKRVRSKSTHGTGCTLASAIACLLSRGFSLRDACAIAKQYVGEAIRTAPGLGHGWGPLNHFPKGFEPPGRPRP